MFGVPARLHKALGTGRFPGWLQHLGLRAVGSRTWLPAQRWGLRKEPDVPRDTHGPARPEIGADHQELCPV